MQPGTIVMMIVILGVVWGGFAVLLLHAMRVERARQAGGTKSSPAAEGASTGVDTAGGENG